MGFLFQTGEGCLVTLERGSKITVEQTCGGVGGGMLLDELLHIISPQFSRVGEALKGTCVVAFHQLGNLGEEQAQPGGELARLRGGLMAQEIKLLMQPAQSG